MEIEDIITKHPSYKLLSKKRLYDVVRLRNPKLKMKDVESYLKGTQQEALQQTFKPLRKPDFFKITAIPRSFQIDVIMLPKYKRYNGGMNSFLLIVDVMSRKAFAYPLQQNTIDGITEAYKYFLSEVGEVHSVTGDNFFKAKQFLSLNKSKGIEVYTDVAKDDHISYGNKLGIVDRLTRTLRNLINKKMVADNDVKWSHWLDDIVDLYNDLPHRGIDNHTPNDMWNMTEKQWKQNLVDRNNNEIKMFNYQINKGETVRTYKGKDTFEKEGMKFSKTMHEVEDRHKYKFIIKGLTKKYKPHQLLKIAKEVARLDDSKVKAVERENKVKRSLDKEDIQVGNVKQGSRKRVKNVRLNDYDERKPKNPIYIPLRGLGPAPRLSVWENSPTTII